MRGRPRASAHAHFSRWLIYIGPASFTWVYIISYVEPLYACLCINLYVRNLSGDRLALSAVFKCNRNMKFDIGLWVRKVLAPSVDGEKDVQGRESLWVCGCTVGRTGGPRAIIRLTGRRP